jgi:hemolysin activation/secretion protein
LSPSQREQLIQPYQEHCLGTAQLNELLKTITITTSIRVLSPVAPT